MSQQESSTPDTSRIGLAIAKAFAAEGTTGSLVGGYEAGVDQMAAADNREMAGLIGLAIAKAFVTDSSP
jgi:hypothetical protein